MLQENENEDTLFTSPENALEEITSDSLLIICDTHSTQLLESEELYEAAEKVVVIDHHRKVVNHIDNAIIFHHEPYASSASEMVTELIQYFGDAGKLRAIQAECLLAGITLDTKNFVMKTGSRTFEAAAYLRKLGADTVTVKKLFASSVDSYKRKTKIVADAEIYRKCAIAPCDFYAEDMRITAPQAADDLLTINNVDASFVLYKTMTNEISVSARSMGSLNVQLIMEALGGGGHQTMAGAQLKMNSIKQAEDQLRAAIDDYYTNIIKE
jgi:c-di-AMP phosphodiesterase-like protein